MNEEPLYPCSKCGGLWPRGCFHEAEGVDRARPVKSQCRECRSLGYFKRKYPTACSVCSEHRRLDQNETCRLCNEASGLRQCRGCGELLPVLLKYYGAGRARCNDCVNALRRSRRR